ncbi:NAD(P)(+) transhydrogenase (Re/Si-specific) subunit beta [Sutcliffiella horikoshii]|uniref:NAD(P)(+) transhydrogenase (Re/Si-specific) subunit beta n=1 Tax=Sutcliffiella horikoshii TaxID=79883 RepID=A0AA94WQ62_9BACI|nr:NAD(P)(+) transhydrogenase (Re/Si-specific) subunit beta [Sutcliffiella horikoshii]TYS58446.1 NAD(P)(+) transhydrogenase (Re/Si-specific) subunit beta [Sutcliffiella horikoshii]
MEFLLIFGVHIFIIGSASMLLSLVVSTVAKKVPYFVTVLSCILLGTIYASKVGFTDVLWLVALFSGLLSAVGVGLVRLGDYFGEKAERLNGR